MKKNIAVTYLFLLLCPSYSKTGTFYSDDYTPLDDFKENNTAKKMWDNELVGFKATKDMMKFNVGMKFLPMAKGNYATLGVKEGFKANLKAAIKGVRSDVGNAIKGARHPLETAKTNLKSAGRIGGKVTGKTLEVVGKGTEKVFGLFGKKGAGKGLQELGKKVAAKTAQKLAVRAGITVGARVGLAGIVGVGTVVAGILTAIDVAQALGGLIKKHKKNQRCHKLCAAKLVQYARAVKGSGYIRWDKIASIMMGDIDAKKKGELFCECKYIGTNLDLEPIRMKKFYLDQIVEGRTTGKIYQKMCERGKNGQCKPVETACLIGVPDSCKY